MISRILVPVDFSECSINAAHYAAQFAQHRGIAIDILHCMQIVVTDPIVPAYFIPDIDSDSSKILRNDLKALAEELEAKYQVKVETHIDSGFVMTRVKEFVERNNVPLVVIGTTTEKDWFEKWMGSFSVEVAKGLTVPVLVIPNSATYRKKPKDILYAKLE